MQEKFEDDPLAPVFFVSHARTHVDEHALTDSYALGANVSRFITDLNALMTAFVPRPPGIDPGFIDLNLDGAEYWERTLLKNVGTCQILLVLMSPGYVEGSAWAAREWDAFACRPVYRRSDGEIADAVSNVIPVRWTRIARPMPRMLREIQWFTPSDLPGDAALLYERYGVHGLFHHRMDQAITAVQWALAEKIQQLHADHWVEPGVPESRAQLRATFEEADHD